MNFSGVIRKKWFAVVLLLLITLVYFLPIVSRINTYIPGGDAMFNAWVLVRNHHCILQQNCQDYTDANIYFPNKDTMLYSETELSAGVISLPLRLITDNPIFIYNVTTILSFFLCGVGMYLLARYLSKGSQFIGLFCGLIFEFAPMTLAATHHLQNLSVFCIPFIVLFILKYFDTSKRRYLALLFISLLYIFYASWYQLVYALLVVGIILLTWLLFRIVSLRKTVIVGSVVIMAVVCTLPLAKEYLRFSKESGATYRLEEKIDNSTSLADYFISPDHTLLGKTYRHFIDHNGSFNPDTYSYVGVSMMILCGLVIPLLFIRKVIKPTQRDKKLYFSFLGIGIVGFVASLGPFLKLLGTHTYTVLGEVVAIPMPYLFVHFFIPQLGFMRGVGRSSILVLFAVCCLFALSLYYLSKTTLYKRYTWRLVVPVVAIVAIELMPLNLVPLDSNKHAYHKDIPEVYRVIKNREDIDNIIVLQAREYPGVNFWFARTEVVLWAGYHNKNVFNGYSGYIPPTFEADYSDFVNLDEDDPGQMRSAGLKYVVLDSELYTNKPHVLVNADNILGIPIYKDERYKIYKL